MGRAKFVGSNIQPSAIVASVQAAVQGLIDHMLEYWPSEDPGWHSTVMAAVTKHVRC